MTNSYTYDMAGVRSSKTDGTTEYKFDTLSGLVMRQTWDGKSLYFLYDDANQPYGFAYLSSANATPKFYYYVLNQQGDVVAIMDSSTTVVARYQYDPWGAVTVTNANSDNVGDLNPLRYRGYYYDSETGLYYLQSRYYDPAIGRFINADTFVTSDVDGFLNFNMYAYCKNNPVNRYDSGGKYSFVCRELDRAQEESDAARLKYNENTINIYVQDQGTAQAGKLNICFCPTEYSNDMNIHIDNSLNITKKAEVLAVLNVIMSSEYYDKSVYGSTSFMYGQWKTHNVCHKLVSNGGMWYKLAARLSGSNNPLESSKELDLRPLDNFGRAAKTIYRIVGSFR